MRHVGSVPLAALEGGALVRLAYPPRDVLVALVDGQPCAIEDACNHAGASLASGPRDGCVVACPLHAYRFDLRTGELLSPRRACAPQRRFDAVVLGETVHVYDPFELAVTGPGPVRTPQG
jgi:3-phenylpropionate/trans-cinnamate dioxygenase ferredoxin subunit